MRRYLPLVCLAFLHTVVDTSALLVSPLWKRLTLECGLFGVSLLAVMLAHSLPTSLAQGVFGFLRGRRRMGWLLLVGPVVAAICLTAVGVAAARAHRAARIEPARRTGAAPNCRRWSRAPVTRPCRGTSAGRRRPR